MIAVGDVIGGRLRIDHVIGAGGMAIVAAATHLELGHQVAVKVLRDELAASPTLVERFMREARAVVMLKTEHVCRVFDVGRQGNGAPFIVMEMLDGVDLARAIAQRPLPLTTAVEYVMQACVALAEAHLAGIVHRDLKPANLFVTRRPDGGPLVKVLDFGIAKAMDQDAHLTHTTGMLGSPGYMSPEQLQSARDVDARTDIWALGVTLYQLLSGRMPFAGALMTEVAVKVANDPPAPLEVEPALAAIVTRCLAKAREARFQDVVELGAALARFGGPAGRSVAAQIAQHARRPSTAAPAAVDVGALTTAAVAPEPQSSRPQARGRRIIAAIAVLGAVAAAVAWLASTRGSQPVTPEAALPRAADAAAVAVTPPVADAAVAVTPPGVDAAVAVTPPVADAAVAVAHKREPIAVGSAAIPPKVPATVAAAFAEMKAKMLGPCQKMFADPKQAAMLPGQVIIECACATGDAKRAAVELAKVTDPQQHTSLQRMCSQLGVTLP